MSGKPQSLSYYYYIISIIIVLVIVEKMTLRLWSPFEHNFVTLICRFCKGMILLYKKNPGGNNFLNLILYVMYPELFADALRHRDPSSICYGAGILWKIKCSRDFVKCMSYFTKNPLLCGKHFGKYWTTGCPLYSRLLWKHSMLHFQVERRK